MAEAARPERARWLFGPAPDLLLGCGLAYLAVFLLQAAVGEARLSGWVPGGILVMLLAVPHYGATLLRVYETPEERRRYRLLAVHGSLLLALTFVVGLRSALIGSLILTVYLTWSPWHYTGQNYGVFLMLARRRGVSITPLAKRWVYVSFLLSYVLTFLAIHGGERDANYAPVVYEGTAFQAIPLGIPAALTEVLIPTLVAAYLISLVTAGALLLRGGRVRDLAPSALLALTQALWFAVPVAIRHLSSEGGVAANVYTAYGFLWIAGAHSAQYLWVTTYYAKRSGAAPRTLGYLGRTALAGYAIWVLPGVVFAPGLLGDLPYESGLALLVAAVVNLHHFVLDGAIWKLREGRVARYLLRTTEPDDAPLGESSRWRPWARRAAWAVGAVSIGIAGIAFVEEDFGFRRALQQGDVVRARTATRRLARIGRDGPTVHTQLGQGMLRLGQHSGARQEFETGLAARPTPNGWLGLAAVAEAESALEEALTAYDEALALAPDHPLALYRVGLLYLKLGRPEDAVASLERASELVPDQKLARLSLERARRAVERGSGKP